MARGNRGSHLRAIELAKEKDYAKNVGGNGD